MAEAFNPYVTWLGLPAAADPADLYVLLGLGPFESDPAAIRRAADIRKSQVRRFRPGPRAADWQKLLDEIEAARRYLFDEAKKSAYDARLRQRRSAESSVSVLDEVPRLAGPAESSIIAQDVTDSFTSSLDSAKLMPPDPAGAEPGTGFPPATPAALSVPPAGEAPLSEPIHQAASMLASSDPSLTNPEPPTARPETSPVHNPMPPMWSRAGTVPVSSAAPAAPAPRPPASESPVSGPTPGFSAAAPSPSRASFDSGASIMPLPSSSMPRAAPTVPGGRLSGPSAPTQPFVVPAAVPSGPSTHLTPPSAMPVAAAPEAAPLFPPGIQGPKATVPYAPLPPSAAPWAAMTDADVPVATPVADRAQPWATATVSPTAEPGGQPSQPGQWYRQLPLLPMAALLLAIVLLLGAIVLALLRQPQPRDVLSQPPEPTHSVAATAGQPSTTKPPAAVVPAEEAPARPALSPQPIPMVPPPLPVVRPQTAPVPAPRPRPSPPANPRPSAGPVTQPAPQLVPEPTAAQQALVHEALRRVRRSLSERDPAAAEAALIQAKKIPLSGPLAQRVHRAEMLTDFVRQFWSSVDSAMKDLGGREMVVGDTRVFVVESGPDRLLIRWAGANRQFSKRTMPSGLARKIAEDWLEKSDTSKLFIGAFLAVDPTMVENDGQAKARKLWQEAIAGGVAIEELLPVLDDPGP